MVPADVDGQLLPHETHMLGVDVADVHEYIEQQFGEKPTQQTNLRTQIRQGIQNWWSAHPQLCVFLDHLIQVQLQWDPLAEGNEDWLMAGLENAAWIEGAQNSIATLLPTLDWQENTGLEACRDFILARLLVHTQVHLESLPTSTQSDEEASTPAPEEVDTHAAETHTEAVEATETDPEEESEPNIFPDIPAELLVIPEGRETQIDLLSVLRPIAEELKAHPETQKACRRVLMNPKRALAIGGRGNYGSSTELIVQSLLALSTGEHPFQPYKKLRGPMNRASRMTGTVIGCVLKGLITNAPSYLNQMPYAENVEQYDNRHAENNTRCTQVLREGFALPECKAALTELMALRDNEKDPFLKTIYTRLITALEAEYQRARGDYDQRLGKESLTLAEIQDQRIPATPLMKTAIAELEPDPEFREKDRQHKSVARRNIDPRDASSIFWHAAKAARNDVREILPANISLGGGFTTRADYALGRSQVIHHVHRWMKEGLSYEELRELSSQKTAAGRQAERECRRFESAVRTHIGTFHNKAPEEVAAATQTPPPLFPGGELERFAEAARETRPEELEIQFHTPLSEVVNLACHYLRCRYDFDQDQLRAIWEQEAGGLFRNVLVQKSTYGETLRRDPFYFDWFKDGSYTLPYLVLSRLLGEEPTDSIDDPEILDLLKHIESGEVINERDLESRQEGICAAQDRFQRDERNALLDSKWEQWQKCDWRVCIQDALIEACETIREAMRTHDTTANTPRTP